MASKIGLSYRREEAQQRVERETNRLQARGVDVGGPSPTGRDPDLVTVERLFHTADLLAAAVARIDELVAERDRVVAERDALAVKSAVKSAKDKDKP